jgi:hypothetical protein
MGSISNRHIFCFLIAAFLIPGESKSQQNQELSLIYYKTSDKIMLRWAPAKASYWIENNKHGYVIERYTVLRDSTRVFPPQKHLLANNIKPAPLATWEDLSEKDDYAAIVAQAIYGESFLLDLPENPNNPYQIIQLANDQETRYNYTLLACDLSYPVAKLAGLGFEDSLINQNESYLYKIYGQSYASLDTAYAYVPSKDSPPLPSIKNLEADFGDRIVSLSWDLGFLNNYYSSYILERSNDNESFVRVGNKPSLFTTAESREEISVAIKTDSLQANNSRYYYRVRGVSPFGIVGPPSNTVSGEGRNAYNFSVEILNITDDEVKINVSWKTDPDILQSQFELATIFLSKDGSQFEAIDSVKTISGFHLKESASTSYFKIEVKDRNGQKHISLPYLYQPKDSIPPETPINLIGTCDSLGKINLRWNRNSDLDLAGYRIFKSISKNSSFRQITSAAVNDTSFNDQVDLNTIRGYIYYQVQAVDHRGNKSDKSGVLAVELKDFLSPTSPRIVDYRVNSQIVEITYAPSPSKDVVAYVLHKIVNDSLEFTRKFSPNIDTRHIIDSLNYVGTFKYYLSAIDSSANISERSNELIINPIFQQSSTPKLSAQVDRTNNLISLQWELPYGVNEIRLYRAEGDDKITLYKSLDRPTTVYEDRQLTINKKYIYMVQFLSDKVRPTFSNELSIVF